MKPFNEVMRDFEQQQSSVAPVITIIHHRDADGYAAAWCALRAVQAWVGFSNVAELIDANYNEEVISRINPNTSLCFILDFSLPADQLFELQGQLINNGKVYVIDHHTTSIEHMKGFPEDQVLTDLSTSGCELTWRYTWPNVNTPPFISYIGDRDMWLFQLPDSKLWNLGFAAMYDYRLMTTYSDLLTLPGYGTRQLIEAGRPIQNEMDKTLAERSKHVCVVRYGEYRIAFINNSHLVSETANYVLEHRDDVDFYMGYYILEDSVKFDLRSKDALLPVDEFAKSLGGGGRRNTAGILMPLGRGMSFVSSLYQNVITHAESWKPKTH